MKLHSAKNILFILAILFSTTGIKAQSNLITDGFSMKVSPGVLSFHGDLSANKYNPIAILRENSDIGFSLTAIKEFNQYIGIQVQYLAGNLYSINEEMNQYFTGSISEFSVSARFTPMGLAPNLNNKFKLQPYISFGLAPFAYRSCLRYIDTDDINLPCPGYENDGSTKASRKNGLAMPLGLGLSIPINQNLAIDLEHSYRITNTDLLDASIGISGKNDWYSFTNVGLRFTISPRDPKGNIPVSAEQKPNLNRLTQTDPPEGNQVAPLYIFIESLMDDVVPSGDDFAVNLRINKGSYNGPA